MYIHNDAYCQHHLEHPKCFGLWLVVDKGMQNNLWKCLQIAQRWLGVFKILVSLLMWPKLSTLHHYWPFQETLMAIVETGCYNLTASLSLYWHRLLLKTSAVNRKCDGTNWLIEIIISFNLMHNFFQFELCEITFLLEITNICSRYKWCDTQIDRLLYSLHRHNH